MSRRMITLAKCVLGLLAIAFVGATGFPASKDEPGTVRLAERAGAFYPENPFILKRTVEEYLKIPPPPAHEEPVRLIVAPHAGYRYSGAIAAAAYKAIEGKAYDAVIVIAFQHSHPFNGISIAKDLSYMTPLGKFETHQEIAGMLIGATPYLKDFPQGHLDEHSLEVQLPFLQVALGSPPSLVPVVMGTSDYASAMMLADALVAVVRKYNVLIVATSDLSHYHEYARAKELDDETCRLITTGEARLLNRHFHRGGEACGRGPLLTALLLKERMGWNPPRLAAYANSGDTTGEKEKVVGYGAFVVTGADRSEEKGEGASFNRAERAMLISRVRAALEQGLASGRLVLLPGPEYKALDVQKGCFVSLWKNGDLRGCIGTYASELAIHLQVQETGLSTALKDHRFPPVQLSELDDLTIEISVLTEPKQVKGLEEVVLGRDGLILKKGAQSGTLLPKVGAEPGWTLESFVRAVSLKAGLGEEGWKEEGVEFRTYQAEDFGEKAL